MALTPEIIDENFFIEKQKLKKVFNNCGVYQIFNEITNEEYIGSSRNLKNRLASHKSRLRHNKHPNQHLQNAWNLYGENNFYFQVLENCIDYNKLLEREKKLISIFTPDYNIAKVENNAFYHSEETKLKISIKSKYKFKKNPLLIENSKKAVRKAFESNTGRKHSVLSKLNMSIAAKKRGCSHFHTKESREKAVKKLMKKVAAYKNEKLFKEFNSIAEAALFVNGNTGNLSTGIKFNKIRYGYYWKKI
jgi:group I intron endonuclease